MSAVIVRKSKQDERTPNPAAGSEVADLLRSYRAQLLRELAAVDSQLTALGEPAH